VIESNKSMDIRDTNTPNHILMEIEIKSCHNKEKHMFIQMTHVYKHKNNIHMSTTTKQNTYVHNTKYTTQNIIALNVNVSPPF